MRDPLPVNFHRFSKDIHRETVHNQAPKEDLNSLPLDSIWYDHCACQDVHQGMDFMDEIKSYE